MKWKPQPFTVASEPTPSIVTSLPDFILAMPPLSPTEPPLSTESNTVTPSGAVTSPIILTTRGVPSSASFFIMPLLEFATPPFAVFPPLDSIPAELRILPIPVTVVPSFEVTETVFLFSFVT